MTKLTVQNSCTLEDILGESTQLELLSDYSCRRCALAATYARLSKQVGRLSDTAGEADPASASKKKRRRDVARQAERVHAALLEDPERELPEDIRLDKPAGRASKQTVFARPPRALVLHLSRSTTYGSRGQVRR